MMIVVRRYILMFVLTAAGWICNGDIGSVLHGAMVATAEAVVGRPATPVSYAGVARRSTVGVGAPGVGAAPANRGGPVNRVGVR
jgi:hypothetical protein